MSVQEVRVPDIGDFSDVAIIEIHVVAGDAITVDDPIITLESDKATMDVPAEIAGTVTALSVSVGDTVSQGDVILSVEVAEGAAAPATEAAKPAVIAADTDGAQPAAANINRRTVGLMEILGLGMLMIWEEAAPLFSPALGRRKGVVNSKF